MRYISPFIFDVRDNYTLRRGLLHCYDTIGIPEPQINNGAIRPRIFYVGMIILFGIRIKYLKFVNKPNWLIMNESVLFFNI